MRKFPAIAPAVCRPLGAETELVSVSDSGGGPAANWPGRRLTRPGHAAGQQRQIH